MARRMVTKRKVLHNALAQATKTRRTCAYHADRIGTTGIRQGEKIIMYLCDDCLEELRKK